MDSSTKSKLTDSEIAREEKILRIENADKMQDQQRIICWVSSLSSIILIVLAMSPIIPLERIETVTALLSTYVVANLGIVASFMAATAWAKVRENGNGH